jgi:hypothetical protein
MDPNYSGPIILKHNSTPTLPESGFGLLYIDSSNDLHIAGSSAVRDIQTKLPVVTITDAAVSMVANTRYEGSIAAFAADRTYTLPAGTAGDVVEVALTTGDDTYELILAGASGVSINGGSAATEWSRLFIDNEFVRFRCFATNDWRVEIATVPATSHSGGSGFAMALLFG